MLPLALSALGLAKSAGSALLKALTEWRVLAVIAAVVALLWGLHETRRADGLAASLKATTAALGAEHGAFLSEQATNRQLIAARSADHKDAVADANKTQAACQARVDAARRSATTISKLLNEPPHANLDPAEPELIPDSLWARVAGR